MVQIKYVGTTSFFQAPMYSYKRKIPIQRLVAVREAIGIIVSLYIAQLEKENVGFPDKKVSRFIMVHIKYVGTTSFFQAPMYSYKRKIPTQRLLAVREVFGIIVSLYIAQLGKKNARFPDKKVSRDFTMVQINYLATTSFCQTPMYSYKKKNTIPTVASCSGSLHD